MEKQILAKKILIWTTMKKIIMGKKRYQEFSPYPGLDPGDLASLLRTDASAALPTWPHSVGKVEDESTAS